MYVATVVPLAFTSFGAYHYEVKRFLKHMARTAQSTGHHFPIDGSFTHTWSTNIQFTIARETARNASNAAQKHLIQSATISTNMLN